MHNARTLVHMELQHNEDVAASVRSEAEQKRSSHGLSSYKEPGRSPNKQTLASMSSSPTTSHAFDTVNQKAAKPGKRRRTAATS